ncbi:MAG: helix-turn-helix domain-containing protein [Methylocella sp.]
MAARPAELGAQAQESPLKFPLASFVEFVLARPIASAEMVAAELGLTPRAARDMVDKLGLREITGWGRYLSRGVL